ncbi:HEPN domain-containing protein, partial [Mycolicibacterium sp. CBMA 361]|uniref:HEPN domain-containing protein n=2 Tax=Mycolicibacterium TaxID=1866885 RepID=UPI00193C902B
LDPDLVGTNVWNALGQLGNKSYLERAEDVIAMVHAAVPEVGVSITRLASHLRDSRITFAHQLRPKKGPLQDRYDRWMVLSMVTPWLLRARLLLEVGVDPQVLREKYLVNELFTLRRAQSEIRVRKLGWDKPPEKTSGQRKWTPTVKAEIQPLTSFALIRELIRSVCGR